MDESSNFDPQVQAAILEIVDNQLRDNDPPETQQTYKRLLKQDYSSEEAKRLIAAVLVVELNEMARANEFFDHARFVKALKRLPRLPWED